VPCPKSGKQAETARFKPKIKELVPEKGMNTRPKIVSRASSILRGGLNASPSQKETP
jgi:hypothetical protein